ncbi:MAG: formimidoylglutamase [Pedobacter sp.]|uniref:formimidoylglutamase n=1 Tax=Pedobacter sp. TaxID=1411316 RepID=UPI002807C3DB|nr:formimidoylglutamase [Pedobacter sp.]MDQ8005092.1 formimidoylglutamase [Pedobacter sp.]
MASFKVFSQGDILNLVNKRDGETKLGERAQTIPQTADLSQTSAKFVLLGIPEDIGVRANYGVGGAHTAWKLALKSFLNVQENAFLKGEDVLVLGEFDIPENNTSDVTILRKAVAEIDDLIFPIIQKIVEAGKIPIVIGGGHNNCYPIIKGASLALQTKVNVLNIDAHTDLRTPEEGRHSGNGFSTAIKDGYLNQYRIFGLHQSYVSEAQLDFISQNESIKAVYFDDLLNEHKDILNEAKNLLKDVKSPLGLEIDLDCMASILSSAATSSGFSLNEVRKLVLQLQNKFSYLHICEGAYQLNDGRKDDTIGKTIAYLISDFIKNNLPADNR